MSKVTAINEIIKRRNLLRKCKEKHTTYVNIDVILMWLDNIKEASKGNYAAWIGSILPTTNVDKYYNYLKELGFEISLRYKGEHGVYVVWC